MTATPAPEPLDAFPLPAGAIVLEELPEAAAEEERDQRRLLLAALRQALRQRQLALPLGPEVGADEPQRLLSLGGFALLPLTTGLWGDEVRVPLSRLSEVAGGPQLLLAAAVDGEDGLVVVQGVLTGPEFLALLRRRSGWWREGEQLVVELECFRGGLERLLTLVQLLQPAALPRIALGSAPAALAAPVLQVASWLEGRLDQALAALGAQLLSPSSVAFRSAAALQGQEALAVLLIPLGIGSSGELVWGEASRGCIERFQLQLIPCRHEDQGGLLLRLAAELPGDLLPDGLCLRACQGQHRQAITSADSTALELRFAGGDEAISASLCGPSGPELVLPPLQLPPAPLPPAP